MGLVPAHPSNPLIAAPIPLALVRLQEVFDPRRHIFDALRTKQRNRFKHFTILQDVAVGLDDARQYVAIQKQDLFFMGSRVLLQDLGEEALLGAKAFCSRQSGVQCGDRKGRISWDTVKARLRAVLENEAGHEGKAGRA